VVPLDRMLVETDSPFLPPQSRRGQPNAPQYLPQTVKRIAELLHEPVELIGTATAENARRVFGFEGVVGNR
jgi:TatD DNase family protein